MSIETVPRVYKTLIRSNEPENTTRQKTTSLLNIPHSSTEVLHVSSDMVSIDSLYDLRRIFIFSCFLAGGGKV